MKTSDYVFFFFFFGNDLLNFSGGSAPYIKMQWSRIDSIFHKLDKRFMMIVI